MSFHFLHCLDFGFFLVSILTVSFLSTFFSQYHSAFRPALRCSRLCSRRWDGMKSLFFSIRISVDVFLLKVFPFMVFCSFPRRCHQVLRELLTIFLSAHDLLSSFDFHSQTECRNGIKLLRNIMS